MSIKTIYKIKEDLTKIIDHDFNIYLASLDPQKAKQRCIFNFEYKFIELKMFLIYIASIFIGLITYNYIHNISIILAVICFFGSVYIMYKKFLKNFNRVWEDPIKRNKCIERNWFDQFYTEEISEDIKNYLNNIHPKLIELIKLIEKEKVYYSTLKIFLDNDLEKSLIFLNAEKNE